MGRELIFFCLQMVIIVGSGAQKLESAPSAQKGINKHAEDFVRSCIALYKAEVMKTNSNNSEPSMETVNQTSYFEDRIFKDISRFTGQIEENNHRFFMDTTCLSNLSQPYVDGFTIEEYKGGKYQTTGNRSRIVKLKFYIRYPSLTVFSWWNVTGPVKVGEVQRCYDNIGSTLKHMKINGDIIMDISDKRRPKKIFNVSMEFVRDPKDDYRSVHTVFPRDCDKKLHRFIEEKKMEFKKKYLIDINKSMKPLVEKKVTKMLRTLIPMKAFKKLYGKFRKYYNEEMKNNFPTRLASNDTSKKTNWNKTNSTIRKRKKSKKKIQQSTEDAVGIHKVFEKH